jgi:hypothetical protein
VITLQCPQCARKAEVPDDFYIADARCHQCQCKLQLVTDEGKAASIGSPIRWRTWLLIGGTAAVVAVAAFKLANGSL